MKSPLRHFRILLFCLSLLSTTLFGCSLLPTAGAETETGQAPLDVAIADEEADEDRLEPQVAPPLASNNQSNGSNNSDSSDNNMANGNSMSASNSMSGGNAMSGDNNMAADNAMASGADTSVRPTGEMGSGGPFTPLGNSSEDQAIAIAADYQEMAWHISQYSWVAEAYFDEEADTWWIDFWSVDSSGEQEEWLAWAGVDLEEAELVDSYVPRELTAGEFQIGRTLAEELVFNDVAVLAAVGDLSDWEHDTYFDRWEQVFYISLYYGIDEIYVTVREGDDGDFYIEGIQDASVLEEDEQRELERNQAIELAWEAEGIWDVLQNYDDWTTYVEHQGGSQYSVAFVIENEELFYAVVDIENWEILDSS